MSENKSPELIALRAEVAALTKKLTASSSDIIQRHCNVCGADVAEGKCPAHPTDVVNSVAIDPTTKRPIIASKF